VFDQHTRPSSPQSTNRPSIELHVQFLKCAQSAVTSHLRIQFVNNLENENTKSSREIKQKVRQSAPISVVFW